MACTFEGLVSLIRTQHDACTSSEKANFKSALDHLESCTVEER
jgi:hypothetical protein